MTAAEIDLTDRQRTALVDELRRHDPALDCVCASDADLIREVERARARTRDDRERG